MLRIFRIVVVFVAVVIAVSAARKICTHLVRKESSLIGFNDTKDVLQIDFETTTDTGDYYMNDTIFEWDDRLLDWVYAGLVDEFNTNEADRFKVHELIEPIEINWNLLGAINYRLRYFHALEAGILAPLFTEKLKMLDGKQVVIKGYTIPFEDEFVSLALSANPLSSCFFCGKASPTSIISLQLKNEKRFKTDAIKTFTGTLHLNSDDPNQFYYILSEASVVK